MNSNEEIKFETTLMHEGETRYAILKESEVKYREIITVYIEKTDSLFHPNTDLISNSKRVKYFIGKKELSLIDLIITLGGDGTILHTSWLYQHRNIHKIPPILPFHFGTLGFLTVFKFDDYKNTLKNIIENKLVNMTIRTRLELNELVVDRGAYGTIIELQLFVDDCEITSILADGLVIATPTGSTAYSLSAGGSLVHPDQSSILLTPIAPHTLTTRPMIIPGSKKLKIRVSNTSKVAGWASFDGRNRINLERNESIQVTSSMYPLLTISREESSNDWFYNINKILNWNERSIRQNPST
ncbi:2936_t:CDS:2 [Entrophospora sp. SA101]|nr:2936_t:CDS:2 [Entrophospora sp. SA101]